MDGAHKLPACSCQQLSSVPSKDALGKEDRQTRRKTDRRTEGHVLCRCWQSHSSFSLIEASTGRGDLAGKGESFGGGGEKERREWVTPWVAFTANEATFCLLVMLWLLLSTSSEG